MIVLTLHSRGEASVNLVVSDLRVSGGALWNQIEHGLIAVYSGGTWKHRGRYFSRISGTGGSCLLFGIAREPSLLSAPLELFSFNGPTFCAAGTDVARYIERQDVWRGLVRPIAWTAMRIVSSDAVSALVEPSKIEMLNPWEPLPEEVTRVPERLRKI